MSRFLFLLSLLLLTLSVHAQEENDIFLYKQHQVKKIKDKNNKTTIRFKYTKEYIRRDERISKVLFRNYYYISNGRVDSLVESRKLKRKEPRVRTYHIEYDLRNRIIKKTEFNYLIGYIAIDSFFYDSLNVLKSVRSYFDEGEKGLVLAADSQLYYDSLGLLQKRLDDMYYEGYFQNETRYSYDTKKRLIKKEQLVRSNWINIPEAKNETIRDLIVYMYSYDDNDLPIREERKTYAVGESEQILREHKSFDYLKEFLYSFQKKK